MDEYEIVTAILAGDNTLELRVFATVDIAVAIELDMTQHLCTLVNRYQRHWEG